MARKLSLAMAALLLIGCDGIQDPHMTDQCLRRQLFSDCMKMLPAGPQSTKYNDWDDVVSECENAAYYQAQRRESQVKPECRP